METINTTKNFVDQQSRFERAKKVYEFLDRINAYEYTQDIMKSKKEKPPFENFKNLLVRINGIAREIPIEQRSFDGENVRLTSSVDTVFVPKHEDKEFLLKYAYDNLEKIKEGEEKYLISVVINAVHFFNDGNGRTSRIMYQLMEKHNSKEEFKSKIKLALGKDGRWDCPDVSPGIILQDIETIILEKYESKFRNEEYPNVSLSSVNVGLATVEIKELDENHPSYVFAKKCLDIARNDSRYIMIAMFSVLGGEKIISMFTDKYGVKIISPIKMIKYLDSDQWQKILDFYYQLKKEHVKIIIDSFIESNKFKSLYHNKETNLKDYFIEEVERDYLENNPNEEMV